MLTSHNHSRNTITPVSDPYTSLKLLKLATKKLKPSVATPITTSATAAPRETQLNLRPATLGANRYRIANATTAASIPAGHLANSHTVNAVSPSPIQPPTRSATGPVNTSANAPTEASSTSAAVSR